MKISMCASLRLVNATPIAVLTGVVQANAPNGTQRGIRDVSKA